MEEDFNVIVNGRRPQKIKQPKTIKSKIKHCGTAPGNLVQCYETVSQHVDTICW